MRDSCHECLLKYDNQNILLVGEESCAGKKNTPYICSDGFYQLAVLLMDEYGLLEADSSTEALILFQEIYKRKCLKLVQNEIFQTNHSEFWLNRLLFSTQYLLCSIVFDLYSVLFRYVFQIEVFKRKMFSNNSWQQKDWMCFISMFLRGIFLFTEAIFQISDMCGLCTSRCIIIIVVCGQDKPIKKIT